MWGDRHFQKHFVFHSLPVVIRHAAAGKVEHISRTCNGNSAVELALATNLYSKISRAKSARASIDPFESSDHYKITSALIHFL